MAGAAASAFGAYKRLYRAGDPSGRRSARLCSTFSSVAGAIAAAHRLAPLLEAGGPASGRPGPDLAEIALARGDADSALGEASRRPARP